MIKDERYKRRKKAFDDWLKEEQEYYVKRYPKKKLSKSVVQWLKRNKVAQKYINTKILEYYHNAQIKMVDIHIGNWDKRDCVHLDFIDFDEQGNMMVFKTKDTRNSWVHGKDIEYRKDMEEEELIECEGVIFPEKKPTTKTGTRKPTKQQEEIIEKLIPLFAGELKIKKMDYYKKVGKYYNLTRDGIRKIAKNYETYISSRININKKPIDKEWCVDCLKYHEPNKH